ncbi:MAG: Rpn family recombination-promoting nuclease/putative transposase [Methylococcales bacterium]|nr:Rpn family recombination-promoting nuclease/putative transposase [Methylococcales bacterium]
MKFVDPKTDIAFKKIFGNEAHKEILIEFLNEILELEYPIADVTILNSYQPLKLGGLKETLLDIKAEDTQQREFLVEMRGEKELAFAKRAMYYTSKAYSQQLGKGEKYHLLKPTIFLGILDFILFSHENTISRHLILDHQTKQHELKDLEFNFIELPKFLKQEHKLETVAEKWLYFIKQADDLDHIPANANTSALKQAYEIAEQHTWSADELEVYESQEIEIVKTRNMIDSARVEGKTEGKIEGKVEIAKTMLAEGFDLETITKVTKLTLKEVRGLK